MSAPRKASSRRPRQRRRRSTAPSAAPQASVTVAQPQLVGKYPPRAASSEVAPSVVTAKVTVEEPPTAARRGIATLRIATRSPTALTGTTSEPPRLPGRREDCARRRPPRRSCGARARARVAGAPRRGRGGRGSRSRAPPGRAVGTTRESSTASSGNAPTRVTIVGMPRPIASSPTPLWLAWS